MISRWCINEQSEKFKSVKNIYSYCVNYSNFNYPLHYDISNHNKYFEYGSPFEAVIVLLSTIISSVVNVFIVKVIVAYAIDRVIVLWKWAWSSDE